MAMPLWQPYENFEPTTIILDMIMPGIDGNELVLWLADKACAARLIIMTGYTPDYAAHAKLLAEYKGLRPGDNVEQAIRTQRATGHPS